jgi:hypothetical protein
MNKAGPTDGFDQALASLDPARIGPRLERNILRALNRIGSRFVRMAVKAVTEKRYESNSRITIALKNGKSTPLANSGQLRQAICYHIPEGTLDLWVGANRNAVHKDASGKTVSTANLVRILHDGATVDVQAHPKVRIALMAQLREIADTGHTKDGKKGSQAAAKQILAAMKQAGKASPGRGKSLYVIPPRPFLADILRDPEFVAFVHAELQGAIDDILRMEAAA